MSTTRQELLAHFDGLLQPERFKDYGPNGLQVEGRGEIRRIVSGVAKRLMSWASSRRMRSLSQPVMRPSMPRQNRPWCTKMASACASMVGVQLGLEGQATFGEQNLGWMAAAERGFPTESRDLL